MKIHKNDQVLITSGKDRGKKGKVLDVFKEESKIDELGLKDVKIDIMTAMTKFKEVKEQKEDNHLVERVTGDEAHLFTYQNK